MQIASIATQYIPILVFYLTFAFSWDRYIGSVPGSATCIQLNVTLPLQILVPMKPGSVKNEPIQKYPKMSDIIPYTCVYIGEL